MANGISMLFNRYLWSHTKKGWQSGGKPDERVPYQELRYLARAMSDVIQNLKIAFPGHLFLPVANYAGRGKKLWQNAWQRLQYSLLKVLVPLHPKFFVVGIRLPLYSYSCTVGKPTRNRLVYKLVANIDEMPYLGQKETKRERLSVTCKDETWQKDWQAGVSFAMMGCQRCKRRSVQIERFILVANRLA